MTVLGALPRSTHVTPALWRYFARSTIIRPALVLLAALVWTLIARWPLVNVDEIDDSFYSVLADLWRRGLPPYIHGFDVKPPGFFLIAMLSQSLFGPTLLALRVVAIV